MRFTDVASKALGLGEGSRAEWTGNSGIGLVVWGWQNGRWNGYDIPRLVQGNDVLFLGDIIFHVLLISFWVQNW